MTKFIRALCFLLILVSISSCEKEELTPETSVPVFTTDISFGKGETFDVNAGDDLFYMFASHQETEDDIIYSGLFGKENQCESECAENFSIKFHQKTTHLGKLTLGGYNYYSLPKDGFKHNYTLLTEDPNSTEKTTWRVGDKMLFGESISLDSNNDTEPGDGLRLLYAIEGKYIVQFDRKILATNVDCDVSLFIDWVENDGLYLEIKTSSPFALVSWSTGTIAQRIKIDPSMTSIYTATVFGGSGCTTDISIKFNDQNFMEDSSIGFNQESFAFASPDNSNNSISISYTDGDGAFYSSSTIGQIFPFNFEVLEITDYKQNENGEPTWKIRAKFDCILFGDNGRTRRINEGEATFAVSY